MTTEQTQLLWPLDDHVGTYNVYEVYNICLASSQAAHRDAPHFLIRAKGAAVHDDHVDALVLRVVHQQLKVLVPPVRRSEHLLSHSLLQKQS